jgi:hypothetical protein
MKPTRAPAIARRKQCGVAAVELAIILSLTFFILPAIVLFARVIMQYNVLQQATHDAAAYLAFIPSSEMKNSDKYYAAEARARAMLSKAIVDAGITSGSRLGAPAIVCSGAFSCGSSGLPATITVTADLYVADVILGRFTDAWTDGAFEWRLRAGATVPYSN